MGNSVKLQVLISAFGPDGILRVSAGSHPEVEGVEYVVSWQIPDGDMEVPLGIASRNDFKVVKSSTRGLSRNRNLSLALATAPLAVIGDDDVDYTSSGLSEAMRIMDLHPNAALIAMRYGSSCMEKWYPSCGFGLYRLPKGYYVSSVEMVIRPAKIKSAGVWFDERFGIGSYFVAGEEQLFVHALLRAGLECRYEPAEICRHEGDTTSSRYVSDPALVSAKGAMISILYPKGWWLRMLTHVFREAGPERGISRRAYFRAWIGGVSRLRSLPLVKPGYLR